MYRLLNGEVGGRHGRSQVGRASDRREPRSAAGVVADALENEAAVALPTGLRLQRPLVQIEHSLRRRHVFVLFLPAGCHLLHQDIVDCLLRAQTGLLQRLHDHFLGCALLRDLEDGVRLVGDHTMNLQSACCLFALWD